MNGRPVLSITQGWHTLRWLVVALAAVRRARQRSPIADCFLFDEFSLIPLRLKAALLAPTVTNSFLATSTPATYDMRHRNWLHFFLNAIRPGCLGLPVTAARGPARFLPFFSATAIAGGIAHAARYRGEPHFSLVASGALRGAAATRAWPAAKKRSLQGIGWWGFHPGRAAFWMPANTALRKPDTIRVTDSGIPTSAGWAIQAGGYAAVALPAPDLHRNAATARQR